MTEFIIILNLLVSCLIAERLGNKRIIGIFWSFLLCFTTSCVIGLVITLSSPRVANGYYFPIVKNRWLEIVLGTFISLIGILGIFGSRYNARIHDSTYAICISIISWGLYTCLKKPFKKVTLEEYINKTIAEYSNNYNALLNALELIFEKQEYKVALPLCESINLLKPEDKAMPYYRGIIYLKLHEYEKAIANLNKYLLAPITQPKRSQEIKIRQMLAPINYYLGYAYFKTGDQENAEKYKAISTQISQKVADLNWY